MTMQAMNTDAYSQPAHIRWSRAVRALARVLAHPEETDQVLVFSTYANAGSAPHRLDQLAALPADTLGHAYARFMKSHGLTPDVFDGPPDDVADPRAAYVIQRMRQTHDLWHVVTHAETDPAGEVALQAFTYAQVGAPSAGILAALGMLKTVRHDARIVRDVAAMLRLGNRANRLVLFAWEDHWQTPLAEVRRLLGLPENPRTIGGYTDLKFQAA
jgi:ubiquinone biosynthesis protein COQ4